MSGIDYIYIIFDIYVIFIFLYIYYIGHKKIPIKYDFSDLVKNNVTFSIIIPIYNESTSMLSGLLDNLRKLNYPNDLFEVIIVDDSEEKFFNLISDVISKYKKYMNIKLIHRNEPKGFKPGALNVAFKHSNGEYLVILDVDTRLPSNYLSVAAKIIQSSDCYYIQARSIPNIKGLVSYTYASFIEFRNSILLEPSSSVGFPFITGYGYIISKDILKKLNGWCEHVLTEDLDLYIKLTSTGLNGALHPLTISESPPSSFKDLRIQQERWIIGSFQIIKKIFKDFVLKGSLPPKYSIFISLFLPLLLNDVALFTPFIVLFTHENINFELISLINIIIYITLIPAAIKLVKNMIRNYGIKNAIIGLGLSSLMYNYLSVKSLYFIVKVLLNKNIKWNVTGKEQSRGSIDILARIILAPIYIAALLLCIKNDILFLFPWILILALSYLIELFLEIYN